MQSWAYNIKQEWRANKTIWLQVVSYYMPIFAKRCNVSKCQSMLFYIMSFASLLLHHEKLHPLLFSWPSCRSWRHSESLESLLLTQGGYSLCPGQLVQILSHLVSSMVFHHLFVFLLVGPTQFFDHKKVAKQLKLEFWSSIWQCINGFVAFKGMTITFLGFHHTHVLPFPA